MKHELFSKEYILTNNIKVSREIEIIYLNRNLWPKYVIN